MWFIFSCVADAAQLIFLQSEDSSAEEWVMVPDDDVKNSAKMFFDIETVVYQNICPFPFFWTHVLSALKAKEWPQKTPLRENSRWKASLVTKLVCWRMCGFVLIFVRVSSCFVCIYCFVCLCLYRGAVDFWNQRGGNGVWYVSFLNHKKISPEPWCQPHTTYSLTVKKGMLTQASTYTSYENQSTTCSRLSCLLVRRVRRSALSLH